MMQWLVCLAVNHGPRLRFQTSSHSWFTAHLAVYPLWGFLISGYLEKPGEGNCSNLNVTLWCVPWDNGLLLNLSSNTNKEMSEVTHSLTYTPNFIFYSDGQ